MSASSIQPDAETSLTPVYPFNTPGAPITLYDGPVGGLAESDVPGVVEYACSPRPDITWSVDTDVWYRLNTQDEHVLLLHDRGVKLPVSSIGSSGWSSGTTLGDSRAPITRVVAHWFNLPKWGGSTHLQTTAADGSQSWIPGGRSVYNVDGWKITLDVRSQHQRVWKDLRRSDVYVMTHVMEIRRLDGGTFTAAEAKPVLSALHVALSFALGRWVAPALPVGQDASGKIVWEEWRPLLCDPARNISSGWWYHEEQAALQDLLNRVIPAFCDPSREKPLRLQMQYAITATAGRGFVEQRIMIGAAGLEHIMWQNLRLTGRLTKRQYGSGEWTTRQMLRTVLEDAGIDVNINPAHLPVAAGFAAERAQRSGQPVDGADLVKWVRNELVHPKEAQEPLYRLSGLTTELWLLTRHYLVLLILHSIDYRGSYRDLARTNGWVGEVEPVPWA